MIEEHVTKLAELHEELKANEDDANEDENVCANRDAVDNAQKDLEAAKVALSNEMIYYEATLERISKEIKQTETLIIDEWHGEHKTMAFDAGTLKFRTTQSLKIHDWELLLHDIIEHTSIGDAGKTYIQGFNLTAVKKYMTVHPQQPEVAELTSKTTVELEQKSGHHSHALCRRHML